MDIFDLHSTLIDDYRSYVSSFITPRDKHIRQRVDEALTNGDLWPHPMVALNPAFESGGTIPDLVAKGQLHPQCADIFRAGKSAQQPNGVEMRLHRHQTDAIEAAGRGDNYVLTTGTGSGKSLSYIVPIVDHVLRVGSGKGIQAIVVYPMNALANSQAEELGKFLNDPLGRDGVTPPVRVARYTGQESREEKEELQKNPPDVLLTNYVMLELILTRRDDQQLIRKAADLRFLVLDELHTYRGRQGADVAMLIRRLRQACGSPNLRCVGTSATMSSEGTYDAQRATVAEVASLLFGDEVLAANVIGETLRRATRTFVAGEPDQVSALKERVRLPETTVPATFDDFVEDPLSSWVESTLGITEADDGRLVRATPRTIRAAAEELANLCKLDSADQANAAIKAQLLAGNRISRPDSPSFKAFAFRLHQFVSRGDTVYVSLEAPSKRVIRMREERADPDDRNAKLFGQVFCRACGQDYSTVHWDNIADRLEPRAFDDRQTSGERIAGYLYVSEDDPWPTNDGEQIERLPEEWIDWDRDSPRVKTQQRKNTPVELRVGKDGAVGSGLRGWFVPSPFRFCLACAVSFSGRRSEASKLATLGSGGRSSATTVMSISTVRWLRNHLDDSARAAQKLLAFSDNRQDSSLQAGHFNDFVQTVMLRAGLRAALVAAGQEGIRHDELAQRVFDALALDPSTYMADAQQKYGRDDAAQALRSLLEYRLYVDFRQGFRFNQPNLEFTGLLNVDYRDLDNLCADADDWSGTHLALLNASPAERRELLVVVLDWLRRESLIEVGALLPEGQELMEKRVRGHLDPRWHAGTEPTERFTAGAVRLRPRRKTDDRFLSFLSPRGSLGRYIKRWAVPKALGHVSMDDVAEMIDQIFSRMQLAGLVVRLADDEPTYRLRASSIVWKAGDGEQQPADPLRVSRPPVGGLRSNPYFKDAYESMALDLATLEAREHTAQVPQADRQEREERFRSGDLPIMYCSPTMELGVDIADLNVVGMRNVPPTPANYAQRSGRAGRGGQPAMVFTYCTSGSPHDQYYFNHPDKMVSGQVSAPRIEVANEDLVRSHVHAVWLEKGGLLLEPSLKTLLDLDQIDEKTPVLLPSKQADIDRAPKDIATREAAKAVIAAVTDQLADASWFDDEWLDRTLVALPRHFEEACQRWWDLYRSARELARAQARIVEDHTRSSADRREAQAVRSQAESQMIVLEAAATDISQSDFQAYRYFASEGFLPGYSFPRLPVVAWVDSGSGRSRTSAEALQRPRFLAINEFGPRALIYHEGRRHRIVRIDVPRIEQTDGAFDVATTRVKRCPSCGHLHDVSNGGIIDNCQSCNTILDGEMASLLRMQKVHTRPVDRINSEEEERQRQGYELISGYRFALRDGNLSRRIAKVTDDAGETLATLQYGDAATLWRMNLGWRRRKSKAVQGFVLDVEKGRWATNDSIPDAESDDKDDPLGNQTRRVIPYVEDTRNVLVVEPAHPWTIEEMASVQSALKRAIQARFELEDNELAVEPLPTADDRRFLLFYESAEGGAGVLRLLVDRVDELAAVVDEALRTCHVDPASGEDLTDVEVCSLACYDCLLGYTNQPDHGFLDRFAAIHALDAWRNCRVDEVGRVDMTPDEQVEATRDEADSELERRFLAFLEDQGARIPEPGRLIGSIGTTPDLIFPNDQLLIYIDGPVHDYPDRAKRDAAINDALRDAGWRVVRFGHMDDWAARLDEFSHYFGVNA